MLKEISDTIISLLRSDPMLQSRVKAWFRGYPRVFEKYPYIAVIWIGGDITYTGGIFEYRNDYEVLIVDLKPNPEEVEDSVMELSERVYDILSSRQDLNGIVDDSKLIRWDSECMKIGEGFIKGVRMVLRIRMILHKP
ncbi:MAG: hypothetical protein QW374_04940 [Candidatus Bathyarchaeia archaeon]|nr:hypothetical protein [Candidatus Bathyarchaeota archaeon]